MKITAFIITTEKNSDRREGIRETWANHIDYLFISDSCDNSDTLKVTDDQSYNSNETKTLYIIQKMPQKYLKNDWFLFCDDDTFVNVDLLMEKLNFFSEDIIYGHMGNSWPFDESLYYLSGGGGFLMHKKNWQKIHDKLINFKTGFNDVTLGLNYRNLNIKIEDSKYFQSQNPEKCKIPLEQVHNYITFHYILNSEQMNCLYTACILKKY